MEQVAVDEVGEASFEGSSCFAGCVAAGDPSFEVDVRVGVAGALGDGDAVDGAVQLPVARAGEPVTCSVAGPHRQWRGAGVAGVRRANEILKAAAHFFGAELDRQSPK